MSRPATHLDLEFDQADRLRRSLRISGVSVAEMADYLEVHRNSVTNWINGHNRPSAAALRLWAMKCGVPYRWLQDGSILADGPDGGNVGDGASSSISVELQTFNLMLSTRRAA